MHAMLVVRPCIRIVAIVNRSPARAEDLARRLRQEYPKLQVRARPLLASASTITRTHRSQLVAGDGHPPSHCAMCSE